MKHRFWYSAKQAGIEPDHYCHVWNGTDWVEYSEWCRLPGSVCNWDDAVLVYETDEDNPQIKVEGHIDWMEDYMDDPYVNPSDSYWDDCDDEKAGKY